MLLLSVVLIIASAYVACAAPCDAIDWLPIADTPARCLRRLP